MENKKAKRQRPLAEKNNSVGVQRHERYKETIDRYNEAMNNGFYLEAITLMESLIADRLECAANYYDVKDHSYSTLGSLTNCFSSKSVKEKVSSDFLNTIETIGKWKNGRNKALHEMAKLDADTQFEDDYKEAKLIAKEGYDLFRKIDNLIQASKQKTNK